MKILFLILERRVKYWFQPSYLLPPPPPPPKKKDFAASVFAAVCHVLSSVKEGGGLDPYREKQLNTVYTSSFILLRGACSQTDVCDWVLIGLAALACVKSKGVCDLQN